MHSVVSVLKRNKTITCIFPKLILEKETWITILFILASTQITALKPYTLLIGIYITALWVVSKDLIKSLWIALIITALFYHGKYFSTEVFLTKTVYEASGSHSVATYAVMFSDVLGLGLLYLLKRTQHPAQKITIGDDVRVAFLMLITIAIGTVSSWLSLYPGISFFTLFQVVKYFIMFFIARSLLTNAFYRKTILQILYLFTLFHAILIIAQYVNHGPLGLPIETLNQFAPNGIYADETPGMYRPGGIATSPNLFAAVFTMMLPILIAGLVMAKKSSHINFIALTLSATIIALICTFSRAAWITVIITTFGLLYTLRKLKMNFAVPRPVATYASIASILLLILLGKSILTRFNSIVRFSDSYDGISYRIHHLIVGKDLMMANTFGAGLNVFQYAMANNFDPAFFHNDITPAHNYFAEIGADVGILGLIAFTLLLYFICFKYEKPASVKSPLTIGLFWGIIGYICIIQFHPWFFEHPVADLFWILGGLYHAADRA